MTFSSLEVQKQIRYIESLRCEDGYRFSHYSDASSLSTAFSVMALLALDAKSYLQGKDSLVRVFSKVLNDKQEIVDEKYALSSIVSMKHDREYVISQSTYFSLIALDILGITFDRIGFLAPYYQPDYLKQWFLRRLEGNFWAESNKLMFLLYFLAYTSKYGIPSERVAASEAIDVCFSMLDRYQDKATGYWGGSKSLYRGAYGAAHLYLFYDYFGREIPYPEKIIDSTLSLHARNGLAETSQGGACEDYDLVDIYLRLTKQTEYRSSEIQSRLINMRDTILQNADKEGGFSYKFFQLPLALHRLLPIRPPQDRTYSYSSLRVMTTPVYYPDSWAVFFRVISLNAIDFILQKNRVCSYDLPGWGFLYRG